MNYLINESSLTGIADAIRSKTASSATMTPDEMTAAINSLPSVDHTHDDRYYTKVLVDNSINGLRSIISTMQSCASCRSSTSTLTLPAKTFKQVNLDSFTGSNPDDTFSLSGGGIKVEMDGYVVVWGSVYFDGDITDGRNVNILIRKNGTEITAASQFLKLSSAIGTSPLIIQARMGDVFTLFARSYEANTCYPGNTATHLDIMYI